MGRKLRIATYVKFVLIKSVPERISNDVDGLKSLKCFVGKVWTIASLEIRNTVSLEKFSTKIKSYAPDKCPCTLFLTHIHQVGFI